MISKWSYCAVVDLMFRATGHLSEIMRTCSTIWSTQADLPVPPKILDSSDHLFLSSSDHYVWNNLPLLLCTLYTNHLRGMGDLYLFREELQQLIVSLLPTLFSQHFNWSENLLHFMEENSRCQRFKAKSFANDCSVVICISVLVPASLWCDDKRPIRTLTTTRRNTRQEARPLWRPSACLRLPLCVCACVHVWAWKKVLFFKRPPAHPHTRLPRYTGYFRNSIP